MKFVLGQISQATDTKKINGHKKKWRATKTTMVDEAARKIVAYKTVSGYVTNWLAAGERVRHAAARRRAAACIACTGRAARFARRAPA